MNLNNEKIIPKIIIKLQNLQSISDQRIIIKYRSGLGKIYFLDNDNKISYNSNLENNFNWSKLEELLELLVKINNNNNNVNIGDDDSLINIGDIPSFEEINEYDEPPVKRMKFNNNRYTKLDFQVNISKEMPELVRKVFFF